MELDEIQRKSKYVEDMEEPKIELQNTYDKRSFEEVDVELMNFENMLSGQDQDLIYDEIRLTEEVTAD